MEHKVDFTAWSGFGECGCEFFTCVVAKELRDGAIPNLELQCPHQRRARMYMQLEAAQAIIERRKAAADENRIKNGHKPSQYENENCPY